MNYSLGFNALAVCASGLQIDSLRYLGRLEEMMDENRALRERLRCAEEYISAFKDIRSSMHIPMERTVFYAKTLVMETWACPSADRVTHISDELYEACCDLECLFAVKPDVKTDKGERYQPTSN